MATVRWELGASLDSPARVRALLGQTLEQSPLCALRDDAVLLVSELTANAVVHARTGVRVIVHSGAHRVRVEVEDDSAALPEVPPPLEDGVRDTRDKGRGLALVERVADAWGVERRGNGKVVWFELALRTDGRSARRTRRSAYVAG